MIKTNKILFAMATVLMMVLASCESYLEPELENRITYEQALENPVFAEGWLLKAYNNLTTDYNFNIDVLSDDAVTNNLNSNLNAVNEGAWAANFNPLSQWTIAYEMNLYINTLLENADRVVWFPSNEVKDELFRTRIKAEAYGLRAWYNFMLLQAHGGVGKNGQLLGFPIVDKVLNPGDDFELPRNTYRECVDFIIEDCDRAIAGLPARWVNTGTDPEIHAVLGARNINRISGLSARLLKSRVALYAASPSFSQSGITWAQAAQYATDVMTANGGLTSLSAADVTFFQNRNSNEIFWSSTGVVVKSNWEKANFPPSLFGNGNTNPTQNFVDAFPMADGTPISESGTYNPLNPYSQRDPRLARHVIFNGQNFSSKIINTYEGSGIDGINSTVTSTFTGYYLKKFMDPAVNLNTAGNVTGTNHFYTYARYTEALLNFAEAANELGGPDNNIGGFTPRQVINALRQRGGIANTTYVNGITTTDAMRALIRNERRIELSFEGNRFWDLRRWGLTSDIMQPAKGLRISNDQTTYTVFDASPRNYQSFQIYGPIPLSETLKYDLIQNAGW